MQTSSTNSENTPGTNQENTQQSIPNCSGIERFFDPKSAIETPDGLHFPGFIPSYVHEIDPQSGKTTKKNDGDGTEATLFD